MVRVFNYNYCTIPMSQRLYKFSVLKKMEKCLGAVRGWHIALQISDMLS
jgi:hypothetical protein